MQFLLCSSIYHPFRIKMLVIRFFVLYKNQIHCFNIIGARLSTSVADTFSLHRHDTRPTIPYNLLTDRVNSMEEE